MSTVRCRNCRTVAAAGYRFCYACGVPYAPPAPAPVPPGASPAFAPPAAFGTTPAELEARRSNRGTSVSLGLFGSLGAIGSVYAALAMDIEAWQKALLLLLVVGGAVFGFTAISRPESPHAAAGRWILRGFAAVAWAMLIGFVVCIGILLYIFALCVTHVGKY